MVDYNQTQYVSRFGCRPNWQGVCAPLSEGGVVSIVCSQP